MNFNDGELVHVKLRTGEEVLAKYEGGENDEVKLNKPYSVIAMPQQGGAMGIGLIPFSLVCNDGTFNTTINSIVGYFSPVSNELEKDYLTRTTNIMLK